MAPGLRSGLSNVNQCSWVWEENQIHPTETDDMRVDVHLDSGLNFSTHERGADYVPVLDSKERLRE